MIECDSDESCCGKDQFECRRPRHSLLPYLQHPRAPSSRCLPSQVVCNGRPDCSDGWDESSCDDQEMKSYSYMTDLEFTASTTIATEMAFIGSTSNGISQFSYLYTVIVVSAILLALAIFSLVAYLCSKKCVSM